MLSLASADNMSAEVELLAVVWEVRESVLSYHIILPIAILIPLKLIQGEMVQSMRKHVDQQG